MSYKTIDFIIEKEKATTKDIAKAFEMILQTENLYRQRLGENYATFFADDNKGVKHIQSIDCPFCGEKTTAFISSETYSEDLTKRIVSAQCINCNKDFGVYQESCLDYQLN